MRLCQSVHARRASGWLLIASVALFGATCVQAQTAAKPPASKQAKSSAATVGVEVQVTDEMRGAGEVSSGVKLPPIPPVTGDRKNPVPSWGKPLPYPVMIADRRNNRLIEISPDKQIIWEFPSPNLKVYRGNEDVNFSPDGTRLAVSEEDNYDLHIVDYDKRALIWTYGVPDRRGSGPGLLNYPDDAHLLADGKFITADIRNCRVLILDPADNSIVTQWGTPGKCTHNPPETLNYPNGATPMENGDILVTEITDAWISRITREGKVVWSVKAPNIRYPSDAFPTVDGKHVIVADFWKPGRVVIFDPATRKPYHKPGIVVYTNVAKPRSRGEIRLRSADPTDAPVIDHRLLGDPQDVAAMIRGLKAVDYILHAPSFAKHMTGRIAPPERPPVFFISAKRLSISLS